MHHQDTLQMTPTTASEIAFTPPMECLTVPNLPDGFDAVWFTNPHEALIAAKSDGPDSGAAAGGRTGLLGVNEPQYL